MSVTFHRSDAIMCLRRCNADVLLYLCRDSSTAAACMLTTLRPPYQYARLCRCGSNILLPCFLQSVYDWRRLLSATVNLCGCGRPRVHIYAPLLFAGLIDNVSDCDGKIQQGLGSTTDYFLFRFFLFFTTAAARDPSSSIVHSHIVTPTFSSPWNWDAKGDARPSA